MFPGWPAGKRAAFLAAYAAAGYTHLPVGIWGAYASRGSAPSEPTFDYRNDLQGYCEILTEIREAGIHPAVFCHTDAAGQTYGPWSRQELTGWARGYLPFLVRSGLVGLFVDGWEFDQIDQQWQHAWCVNGAEHRKWTLDLRDLLGPTPILACHFGPDRTSGWGHESRDGGTDESAWWSPLYGVVQQLLYQVDPEKPLWLVKSDVVGGPSMPQGWQERGDRVPLDGPPPEASHDIGNVVRLRAWADVELVMFEFANQTRNGIDAAERRHDELGLWLVPRRVGVC